MVVLAAEELGSVAFACFATVLFPFLTGRLLLLRHEKCMTLHQEGLDCELVDQPDHLVNRMVHVNFLFFDQDVNHGLFLAVEADQAAVIRVTRRICGRG